MKTFLMLLILLFSIMSPTIQEIDAYQKEETNLFVFEQNEESINSFKPSVLFKEIC
ncbi:hypothetical protein Amet_1203 [Alkaliphilus metalliredigens QYMF]|uniref:Uncharacterized protein n=1 Tax=Alkaliphilus metalliredigens (strain QYMF) TaxID=293826 RepID=A6TMJ3_ALKMQ|nr:hypothetical protein [Alkaliphilus metalliredigens]ABR47411.1 hypothetical protein Amet_1203 [Alkaliphilus metalliredigens QYMF]